MNAPVKTLNLSRRAVLKGGAITVGFALTGIPSRGRAQSAAVAKRILDSKEVDAFLAVNATHRDAVLRQGRSGAGCVSLFRKSLPRSSASMLTRSHLLKATPH
jgi:hypothetical protein